MQRPFHRAPLALALASLLACAARSPQDSSSRVDRNLLTGEQLRSQHFENAYDAIEALRSNWLASRGPDSFQTPTIVLVYLDNVRLGGVEMLRGISTQSVASIQRFDGLEATARWGIGHGAGVIYVTSWAAGAGKTPPTDNLH